MHKLLDLGKKMGLKEEDLHHLVKDEQSRMRDEREKPWEKGRTWISIIDGKDRTEREQAEREDAKEMEDKKEQFAILEHSRKMEEIELEAKLQTDISQRRLDSSPQRAETQHRITGPKLPAFDDSKDNIDAYIQRFEIYAASQK